MAMGRLNLKKVMIDKNNLSQKILSISK